MRYKKNSKYINDSQLSGHGTSFSNTCFVGQTEFGSYVTPLIFPLLFHGNKRLDFNSFDDISDIDNLLTRKITKTFMNSVEHMISFINKDKGEKLLNNDKNYSVDVSSNPNFYSALGIMGSSSVKKINIDVKWAIKDPVGVANHLVIERKHFEALKDITQTLTDVEDSQNSIDEHFERCKYKKYYEPRDCECLVVMPYGSKGEYSGGVAESNYVYRNIICPAVKLFESDTKLNVEIFRCDNLAQETITSSMIEHNRYCRDLHC